MTGDPLATLAAWIDEARAAGIRNPDAMALATVGPDGTPSNRFVLCRGLDERGPVFYTSYESQKGRELDARPRAAAVFYWEELERQVRVTGAVERVTREESDAYFQSRPRGNRLAAWVSTQSVVVATREELERRFSELERDHEGRDVELPAWWGGFRVHAEAVELWWGRRDRLHERSRFVREPVGGWREELLSP